MDTVREARGGRGTRAGRSPASPRRALSATEQPGNSFRYLYWRLSEKEFQQLCAALLRHKYDGVQCFPVGMKDGGVDITRGSTIYQVKWSSKLEQNPDRWLSRTIDGERENIKRLIREKGVTRYILMTSVAGTTTDKDGGSIQKLKPDLKAYSTEFGIPVECWWQGDIDAEVDGAPDAIKWSYQEMLAGSDAIRLLMHEAAEKGRAAGMQETVLQVMATQSREDARVKFTQGDVEKVGITDMFVDVQASLVERPRALTGQDRASRAPRPGRRGRLPLDSRQPGPGEFTDENRPVGAVEYVLHTTTPLIYLLGAPGQGKSTLGQYVSQIHRAALLPGDVLGDRKPPHTSVTKPKLPLRVDLKDYAAWICGHDPFSEEEAQKQPKRRRGARQSLDLFLADFCSFHSGGREVAVEDVQDLLARYPTLLVLDGLDEVADPELRSTIVEQIQATASRMAAQDTRHRRFQILVTSRPNASGLAEPDREIFETLRLEPLTQDLQHQFVTKWCEVNGIAGKARAELRRVFFNRMSLEHVAQLADNPMQLTILLFLISRKGESVPVSRTPLYTDYMATLMDREVSREQIEREQVPQVHEITAFLGWHMHSGVETKPSLSKMSRQDIETALIVYFRTTEGPVEKIAELFRAASDRFWALTSKIDGTFEFSVQPVREYFTARYLAEWAGSGRRETLPKREVLQHLISRPYWLNTARFYAGFATPNELGSLRYGLEEAFEANRHPLQERVAVWALLSDGVFAHDIRVQRDVVALLADDLTVLLATAAPDAAVNFPKLAQAGGGAQLASALCRRLEDSPDGPLAHASVQILRDRIGWTREDFTTWWMPRVRGSIGRPEHAAWLELAAHFGPLRIDPEAVDTLPLATADQCRAAIAAGASPSTETPSAALLQAVLNGWCSDTPTSSTGEAGLLLRVMRPQWFHQLADARRDGPPVATDHLWMREKDRSARSSAWGRLVEIDDRYAALRKAANPKQMGQKGTTEPWQNPARQLSKIHGPSWLAAEIAIAGAASANTRGSGSIDPHGEALGPDIDYGIFVVKVHERPEAAWWREMHERYEDSLSRRTWALALLATADTEVVEPLLTHVDACLAALSNDDFSAFAASSSRVGASQAHRRLLPEIWRKAADMHARTQLVLTHFTADLRTYDVLAELAGPHLAALASAEPASWAVARAITARLAAGPDPALFAGLAELGPISTLDLPRPSSADGDLLPADAVVEILDSPAQYPTAWVIEAERKHSAEHPETPLEKLAVAERWLPYVPRMQP